MIVSFEYMIQDIQLGLLNTTILSKIELWEKGSFHKIKI